MVIWSLFDGSGLAVKDWAEAGTHATASTLMIPTTGATVT